MKSYSWLNHILYNYPRLLGPTSNKYSQWSSAVSFNVNVTPNSKFQILTASDKAASDNFGCSVSISGNVAIVGASNADPGGTTNAGKAYIFV